MRTVLLTAFQACDYDQLSDHMGASTARLNGWWEKGVEKRNVREVPEGVNS